MSDQILDKKIDFLAIATVEDANPNGDPLNGNRPRQHYDNVGFITPVCIKRKLRNRLQDMGRKILIQQNDRTDDGITNISERIDASLSQKYNIDMLTLKKKIKDWKSGKKKKKDIPDDFISDGKLLKAEDIITSHVLETFEDVREFGATLALGSIKTDKNDKGISIGIRGAVTIQQAKSVGSIDIDSNQITKSTNSEPGDAKGSDTMGMMHSVRYGVYIIKGSVNPHFARKNGFTNQDAEDLKKALSTLFVNDESAARPAGSMNIMKMYWWEQAAGQTVYSDKKVFDTIKISIKNPEGVVESWDDLEITEDPLPDLKPEIIGEN